ncbi:hypothetical protein [Bradyrhizobium sp. dw_78]|uniref:hypothetical protein n=1 Tax=Bradyrhizobium sp. dw_78 TaxID=2719793 RepID=UPI001BD4BDE9|nr:hypothetical protein [Bradyrhizobium sp. dw_78]
MAAPIYETYTTTGAQDPIPLNYYQTPFNASVFVYINGGTATYGVQYTADPTNSASITPRWFDDANMPAGTAASATSNYMFPVRAVRVNITAITGSVEFKILQGV